MRSELEEIVHLEQTTTARRIIELAAGMKADEKDAALNEDMAQMTPTETYNQALSDLISQINQEFNLNE